MKTPEWIIDLFDAGNYFNLTVWGSMEPYLEALKKHAETGGLRSFLRNLEPLEDLGKQFILNEFVITAKYFSENEIRHDRGNMALADETMLEIDELTEKLIRALGRLERLENSSANWTTTSPTFIDVMSGLFNAHPSWCRRTRESFSIEMKSSYNDCPGLDDLLTSFHNQFKPSTDILHSGEAILDGYSSTGYQRAMLKRAKVEIPASVLEGAGGGSIPPNFSLTIPAISEITNALSLQEQEICSEEQMRRLYKRNFTETEHLRLE